MRIMNSAPGTRNPEESTDLGMAEVSETPKTQISAETQKDLDMAGLCEMQISKVSAGTQTEPEMTGLPRMQITQKSAETQTEPDTQSGGTQTDVGMFHLFSQIGGLVPVQGIYQFIVHTTVKYIHQFCIITNRQGRGREKSLQCHNWIPSTDILFYQPCNGIVLFPSVLASGDHVTRNGNSFQEQMNKITKIILDAPLPSTNWWFFRGYHTVGIFSLSSEDDYEWLLSLLKSEALCSTVSAVLPHCISNNEKQKFREVVSQCTFGILYHTKNRGRINITDVCDSLYSSVIWNHVSSCPPWCDQGQQPGRRDNVIVVVDDVEDNSEEEKTQILKIQPKIGTFAQDLLLCNKIKSEFVFIEKITNEESENKNTELPVIDRNMSHDAAL
ncbi:uncharacterized protein [Pyxicephalus adspersus]|uniref:uncharacterized protein n=1 Tax=Pyxicephalus adspersus TaxID=30357 RepID=UPI003B59C9EE